MTIAPEQVSNVWAGDAVRFAAPLGDFRRPGPIFYIIATAFCMGAAIWAIAEREAREPGIPALSIVALTFLLAVTAVDAVALGNRWIARRIVRRTVATHLGALATACWLRALISGPSQFRLDAADWIGRTGPDGPRVLLREVDLPAIAADGAINEEEPIDTWTERRKAKRRGLWLVFPALAVFVWLIIGSGTVAVWQSRNLFLFSYLAVWGAWVLFRLGVLGGGMYKVGAFPGGIRVLTRTGPEEFTRENSVVLIEPSGTSEVLRASVMRTDGRCTRMQFVLGPTDPMLARLLSRWCWRGGAGAQWTAQPLRDSEPIAPETPTKSVATTDPVVSHGRRSEP